MQCLTRSDKDLVSLFRKKITSYRLNTLAVVRIASCSVLDRLFRATFISWSALTYTLSASSDIHCTLSALPELARDRAKTAFFRVLSVGYSSWIVFVHPPRVSCTAPDDSARPLGRYADQKLPTNRLSLADLAKVSGSVMFFVVAAAADL